jgi:hypothetical protein
MIQTQTEDTHRKSKQAIFVSRSSSVAMWSLHDDECMSLDLNETEANEPHSPHPREIAAKLTASFKPARCIINVRSFDFPSANPKCAATFCDMGMPEMFKYVSKWHRCSINPTNRQPSMLILGLSAKFSRSTDRRNISALQIFSK